jgi:hypothetical protein
MTTPRSSELISAPTRTSLPWHPRAIAKPATGTKSAANPLRLRNALDSRGAGPGSEESSPPDVSRAPPIFASVLTAAAIEHTRQHLSSQGTDRTGHSETQPLGQIKARPVGGPPWVHGGGCHQERGTAWTCGGGRGIPKESARRHSPGSPAGPLQSVLQPPSHPQRPLDGERCGHWQLRLPTGRRHSPPHSSSACRDQLCEPFPPGDVWIVPTKGWTWVQLRGVDVSYLEDEVDYVYEGAQLLEAFAANPCFQGADIMVPPHFQGNPANFKQRTATVIAAISDPDNSQCQRASTEGVCMFGHQVKFVRAGDSPSLVQCSRCHQIGHYYSSPKCRLPPGDNKCFRCGGPHHSDNHDFECTGTHAVQGVCNCPKKCILCKGSGHTAREKACPRRGDFAPPRLLKPAPVPKIHKG